MKKVKIMLMSMAVLAIVGGALAFKASKFTFTYCAIPAQYTFAIPNNTYYCPDDPNWVGTKVCADLVNVRTMPRVGVPSTANVCTALKMAGQACNVAQCLILATVFQDN